MARVMSEHESKQFLAGRGIAATRETTAHSLDEALTAAGQIGYPVAVKASGAQHAHKTERGLVQLWLRGSEDVAAAWARLTQALGAEPAEVLVQEMLGDPREFVAGLVRDPQFGPTVMFGLGGVYTEALKDVAFRVAPLTRAHALDMQDELRGRSLLLPQRGGPSADREALADLLVELGRLGLEEAGLKEIDINPLKLTAAGRPLAVDALVVWED